MDFSLTDEQRSLQESMGGFARRELAHDIDEAAGRAGFHREVWATCGQFGVQGLNIPVSHGGQGADTVTTMLALEALGRHCLDNGLLFALNAQMWAVQDPILHFGTEDQKQRYLPELCSGSMIGAHAMSEPDSGSDSASLRTLATKSGEDYRLTGSKIFVSNGPIADVFLAFATSDPERGYLGLSGFLVDRNTPGLTVGPPIPKMGLSTSPMSELFFDDCPVPAGQLLGRKGRGMQVFNQAIARERALILASTVGTMERLVDESVDYVNERQQFGTSIGKFQAVSHRVVDMKLRLETARLLLYRLGWLLDQGLPADLDIALVKLHLGECLVESAGDALQLRGGYGYMKEYGIEREVRDAFASRIYSGTSDIQRNLVARALGI